MNPLTNPNKKNSSKIVRSAVVLLSTLRVSQSAAEGAARSTPLSDAAGERYRP